MNICIDIDSNFSEMWLRASAAPERRPTLGFGTDGGFACPPYAYTRKRTCVCPAALSLFRPSFAPVTGHGILTVCPSVPPFGLSLGPDLPDPINVVQETLVFRRGGFPPPLSLLMPTFAFPRAPKVLAGLLRRCAECSPTQGPSVHGTASAVCLTPAYYPRPTARLVSCYALFR